MPFLLGPRLSGLRRGLAIAAGGLVLLTAVADPSAYADRRRPVPTAEARAAGVKPGDAFMGWRSAAAQRDTSRYTKSATPATHGTVYGIDVSGHQGEVDWASQWAAGKKFAYVKATEGSTFRNPYFSSQYNGSYQVGMIRGAYHFANPAGASATVQADYFVANGGGWTRDGRTLPGVLDIEFNPYGASCYGLTDAQMVSWVKAFLSRYKERTGRDAVIYTNYYWWVDCTANSTAFRSTNPLWVARYASTPGTLPGGWPSYTFWQYSSTPIDQDRFAGRYSQLKALATG